MVERAVLPGCRRIQRLVLRVLPQTRQRPDRDRERGLDGFFFFFALFSSRLAHAVRKVRAGAPLRR